MPFGPTGRPYMENPFAGRIIRVHWGDDENPPVASSGTKEYEVFGLAGDAYHTEPYWSLMIHDLFTTSIERHGPILDGSVGDIGPLIVIPGGVDYSISMSSVMVPGFFFDYPRPGSDLWIELSVLEEDGSTSTIISEGISPLGELVTTTESGKTTGPVTYVVRGPTEPDSNYAHLRATVSLSVSYTPPPLPPHT